MRYTSSSWKVLPVVRSALSTIAMINSTEILKLIISEDANYCCLADTFENMEKDITNNHPRLNALIIIIIMKGINESVKVRITM